MRPMAECFYDSKIMAQIKKSKVVMRPMAECFYD